MKNRIREIMQMQGMTIQNLVRKSDVSRRTVQNILSGADSCHVETLIKLANALEVSPAELFLEPHETIVRYECVPPIHVEFAEEHGVYDSAGVEFRTDKTVDNGCDKDSIDRLAGAVLECFHALSPEVQRKFFELYSISQAKNYSRKRAKERL